MQQGIKLDKFVVFEIFYWLNGDVSGCVVYFLEMFRRYQFKVFYILKRFVEIFFEEGEGKFFQYIFMFINLDKN